MFDTHCHLNFKAFEGKVELVIKDAKKSGVDYFVVPGTDIETSKKAVELAEKFKNVYAAIGIHPHHVKKIQTSSLKSQNENLKSEIKEIDKLLTHPKVIAVGEVGLDRYYYQKTKYLNYQINEDFIKLQKWFFLEQLRLAKKYQKTVIIHNRQAKKDLLEILKTNHQLLTDKVVFHCCEADSELLDFAIKNHIFIGVDGDVVYDQNKQEFVKKIPLDLLALETDSPFLSPNHQFPNQPANLRLITEFLAKILKINYQKLAGLTTKNSFCLFGFN